MFALTGAYLFLPQPMVVKTSPDPQSLNTSLKSGVEIVFNRPVERKNLQKTIQPEIPGIWVFENPVYSTHLYRKLVFYPKTSFRPKTTYKVTLSNIKNFLQVSNPQLFTFHFQTQDTAQVERVEMDDAIIQVYLDQPVDISSKFNFEFYPFVPVVSKYDSGSASFTLIPKAPMLNGRLYTLKVNKSDIVWDLTSNAILERSKEQEIYTKTFIAQNNTPQVLGIETKESENRVRVVGSFPQDGWTSVASDNSIKIRFNQDVNHVSAQSKFSIVPNISGNFSWKGDTLVFTPENSFSFNTRYNFFMASGVESGIGGFSSINGFASSFTTQESQTKLTIPVYLQQHALSCEAASLRMVLSYKGIEVSEDALIDRIGSDPTPHRGNIWGNPYVNFVGNINGKQMVNGYGVYWEPIRRVAQNYRAADSFENWDIGKLTDAILKSNPVIVWVYIKNGQPTYWNTPGGDRIYAVPDEHTVVVTGFVGTPSNPSQIIVNDPLVGEVNWDRDSFNKKWDAFGRSGVVIY